MSRPSYATENWLRTQLRLRDERIKALEEARARAEDLLQRVRDGEPWTTRDVESVLGFLQGVAP